MSHHSKAKAVNCQEKLNNKLDFWLLSDIISKVS
jgi:hypothetical protein